MDLALIDRSTQRELDCGFEIRLTGWTEERYWVEAPSDRYCEFVDGEVIMHSPVEVSHTWVVRLLTVLIQGFCRVRGAGQLLTGPTAVRLRPGLAREPDLFVLSTEDAAAATGCRIESLPLFVVEVAGQDSERRDLVEKAPEYAGRGVAEYWVVLLARRQVVVHRPGEAGQSPVPLLVTTGRLSSTALPGFWIDVDWLWRARDVDELACLKLILGVPTL